MFVEADRCYDLAEEAAQPHGPWGIHVGPILEGSVEGTPINCHTRGLTSPSNPQNLGLVWVYCHEAFTTGNSLLLLPSTPAQVLQTQLRDQRTWEGRYPRCRLFCLKGTVSSWGLWHLGDHGWLPEKALSFRGSPERLHIRDWWPSPSPLPALSSQLGVSSLVAFCNTLGISSVEPLRSFLGPWHPWCEQFSCSLWQWVVLTV